MARQKDGFYVSDHLFEFDFRGYLGLRLNRSALENLEV
jgi:hypothetical protein